MTAFAEGDRRQLRSLLSREVYDGFDHARAQVRDILTAIL
jgi:predicted lipid-binding transport protein (Tim44 family)